MSSSSKLRADARTALRSKWGVAVGTGFVASLLGALTAFSNSNVLIEFTNGINSVFKFFKQLLTIITAGISIDYDALNAFLEDLSAFGISLSGLAAQTDVLTDALMPDTDTLGTIFTNEAVLKALTAFAIVIVVVLLLVLLCNFLISCITFLYQGPLSVGYAKFNLHLVTGRSVYFSDIFAEFKRLGQCYVLILLRNIYVFLWSLLFVLPGYIASYSYAMAPYILSEHPDMTATEAIRTSKQLMRGNKWKLFCLRYSFIGWDILNAFTFGIGLLWLIPYKETTYALFYQKIKAQNNLLTGSYHAADSYNYADGDGSSFISTQNQ